MGGEVNKLIILTVIAVISTYIMSNSMLALIAQHGNAPTATEQVSASPNNKDEEKDESGQVEQKDVKEETIYVIQNGVFESEEGAGNLVDAINYHGFPSFKVKEDGEYKVYSNINNTEDVIRTIQKQQKDKGIDNYLVSQEVSFNKNEEAKYLFQLVDGQESEIDVPEGSSDVILEIITNYTKWKESEELIYKNTYHKLIFETLF
ncbi:hypothetical protein PRVXT_001807 [Proteinivorax tanatarense]|uniref:SPOR domain-containing protein n=1 Tax=Proteinivorax tanatarense TaxID=1260629 RepID=A0AAU7VIC6_9FIRM